MVLDAILSIVMVIACGVVASMVSDFISEGKMRVLVGIVIFVVLLSAGRGVLNRAFKPSIDEELQKEELFVVVKEKYPEDYQKIVDKIQQTLDENGSLSAKDGIVVGRKYLAPILIRRLQQVDDGTRSQFVDANVRQMKILRDRGHGECFDLMMDQITPTTNMDLLKQSFEQSGVNEAMIAVYYSSGFDKSIVSEKKMQETLEGLRRHLFSKYKKDVMLLAGLSAVRSTADKQKVCDMTIEMFTYLNQPNNKEKMATLRKILTAPKMAL